MAKSGDIIYDEESFIDSFLEDVKNAKKSIFIVSPFPSGLVLYWLTNNLISIVQQKVLKAEGDKISPLKGTLIGSAVIYGLAYILTLL